MLAHTGGQMILFGVLVCLIGIGFSGKTGMLKEKDFATGHEDKGKDFSLVKGLIIAIISGILSSFFNFGIEARKPLAEAAVVKVCNPLFQNNVTYIVVFREEMFYISVTSSSQRSTEFFWMSKTILHNKKRIY